MLHSPFTLEGLIVGLSDQRRLPAGASRSSPAGIPAESWLESWLNPGWIPAGILAECWCHLVRAGDVAALFPCELLRGARSITCALAATVCHPPQGGHCPLFPPLAAQGWGNSPRLRPLWRLDLQRGLGTSYSQLPSWLRSASASVVFINKGRSLRCSNFCGFVSRGLAEGWWNASSHRALFTLQGRGWSHPHLAARPEASETWAPEELNENWHLETGGRSPSGASGKGNWHCWPVFCQARACVWKLGWGEEPRQEVVLVQGVCVGGM